MRAGKRTMLFRQQVLNGISDGQITVAFRRWRRPTIKAGGTLITPSGLLAILSIDRTVESAIAVEDVRKSGYQTVEDLLASIRPDGDLYRIQFEKIGEDPRIALRADGELGQNDVSEIQERLARFDRRSRIGPWTKKVLKLLSNNPEMRAAELASRSSYEKEWLKTNIRKLKNLGLTESLSVGYRLSPRGQAYVEATREIP